MTSHPETLTVKKVDQDEVFCYKYNCISSQNDPNITQTKNSIMGYVNA